MILPPGTRLGPYEIVEPLGKGGMGEVYRAKDTRLPREVAIKVSAEKFTERFAREAKIIATLNHPNICTLYDVGPNYLVMEMVDGPTLKDRIEEGALTLEQAARIGRQEVHRPACHTTEPQCAVAPFALEEGRPHDAVVGAAGGDRSFTR